MKPTTEYVRKIWDKTHKYRLFQDAVEEDTNYRPSLYTVFHWLRKAGVNVKESKRTLKAATTAEGIAPIVDGEVHAPDELRGAFSGKRYVFTCAQNNTSVHADFLSALLIFCKRNEAELVVGGITYNKTGFQNSHKDADKIRWADEVLPYMLDKSVEVAPDLVWCGELNILPTAVRPLSGLESYCRHASGIVPHTKVALSSVPRVKGAPPKFMYSTGAVTKRNYIEQRAGQRASFHHVFGALYVEINDSGEWFARQLIANNKGEFYDIDTKYTARGWVIADRPVIAINWGDLHAECIDNDVRKGMGNMLETLRPHWQFVHDVSDFRARNHHNIKDPYIRAAQTGTPEDSVELGLRRTAGMLNALAAINKKYGMVVVVHSNHDDALTRWLREADYREDPVNARTFLKLQQVVYDKIACGELPYDYSLLGIALRPYLRDVDHVQFLSPDETFKICESSAGEGIECGMHGHLGANGRRGNPLEFTRLGCKCNTGHTHCAGIVDGVYTAGVSCPLDMGYNRGATGWSHSHIVTYANGKRAIITQRGSAWRA